MIIILVTKMYSSVKSLITSFAVLTMIIVVFLANASKDQLSKTESIIQRILLSCNVKLIKLHFKTSSNKIVNLLKKLST